MRRETLCFSIYSLISMRIMLRSSSKSDSARVLASSVLPTPVGPRKINEPFGRFGSLIPARAEEGFDPDFGARPLRRLLTHTVETELSKKIIVGDVRGGDVVELGFDGKNFTFKTL